MEFKIGEKYKFEPPSWDEYVPWFIECTKDKILTLEDTKEIGLLAVNLKFKEIKTRDIGGYGTDDFLIYSKKEQLYFKRINTKMGNLKEKMLK